jgi:replicative DNA helicase
MDKMQPLERDLFLEKPLPSNTEAEKIIVGAALMDNTLIAQAAEVLSAEDFYHTRYKFIYQAMLDLFAANQPIEPIGIIENLKTKGATESMIEIGKLAIGLPFFTNIHSYVEVVKQKSTARKLIKACANVQSTALSETENIAEVLDLAEQSIYNLRDTNKNEVESLGELVFASYNESVERQKSEVTTLGLKTNLTDIDLLTAGLQETDLIIIAARPSMGKSSLSLDICKGATEADENAVVAYFSLEMSKRQCADRLICSIAEVDSTDYRLGNLNQDQWKRASNAAENLYGRKIFIDDSAGMSVLEVKAKARQIAAKNKRLDLIVIDYMQLMRGKGESRQQEVSEISRDLKALAKDLKVPVIALSQLSRACEARTDKRPLLSDLRESGSIEQDADIVAFIYRDEYYNPTPDNSGVAELIFRKHRHGATDTVKLGFIKQYAKFVNLY